MAWWNFWRREKASNSHELFKEIYCGRMSLAGKRVTFDTAMRVAVVFACSRVIAEGIAQVPLKLMQESEGGKNRIPAKKHPLYDLLAVRPNQWQTSFEFRETMGLHAALAGRFICYKNIVRGQLRELIPFLPASVQVIRRDDGELEYEVSGDKGAKQIFPASVIWHVKGPSWNAIDGMEILDHAREAIGLSIATEESAATLHKNGIQTSGTYSVEGTLTETQHASLTKWIAEHYQGSKNAWKPLILDHGAKWLSSQMSSIDAQHLETRKYQIEEVCRFFRVMPIMVGYSDKTATYASAEQMFLAHVVHCLSPWYSRLEQSIDANLLTPKERAEGYYSDFVEEGLLRGDMRTTAEVLSRYTERGIMTRNEARAKLDMNPLEGLDEPLTPVNLTGDNAKPGDNDNAQNA